MEHNFLVNSTENSSSYLMKNTQSPRNGRQPVDAAQQNTAFGESYETRKYIAERQIL